MHPEIKSPQKPEVVFPEEDSPEALQRIAQASRFGDMMYFVRKGRFETKAWREACIKCPGSREAEEAILRYLRP